MTFRKIAGSVIAATLVVSSVLAIGGIWGWIQGDTAMQLFATSLVVAGMTVGLSFCVDKFFGAK